MRSLNYLYNLAEAYILQAYYYEPDALDKKMIAWPDIKTAGGSALTRFNAKKDVCTFYSVNDLGIALLNQAFNFTQCLSSFRYGKQHEKPHHQWHNNEAEFSEVHLHLIKSQFSAPDPKEQIERVTPEEFKCFFKNLKKFERQEGLCKAGPDSCLVTRADSVAILASYTAYYKEKLALNQEREEKLRLATQQLHADLQEKCLNGGKSFAHAFASTLLDKYFQPYMQTQRIAHSAAICESLRSLLTLLMTQSLISTMTETMIRNGLKPVLMKLGVNLYAVERILTGLGTAVAFAQNPFSLVDLGLNGVAAATGENLAYQIIHALPKLKAEPADNSVHNEASVAGEVGPATVRRRKLGS